MIKIKVKIQKFTEQEEWVDFKAVYDWDVAVKEVADLNKEGNNYRALWVNCFLTHIYCSGFYTVPTVRFY